MRFASVMLVGALGCGSAPEVPPEAHQTGEAAEAASTAAAEWKHYGAAFTVDQAIPVGTVLGEPSAHAGKTVRVEGRIADVCQKKGCWMVLAEEQRTIRIVAKDHGFEVDKDAGGSWASVEGTLIEKPNDPAEAEHYASESTKPELAPEATAADKKYELVATAVAIRPS